MQENGGERRSQLMSRIRDEPLLGLQRIREPRQELIDARREDTRLSVEPAVTHG